MIETRLIQKKYINKTEDYIYHHSILPESSSELLDSVLYWGIRIIFPPLLIWDGLKFAISSLLSKKLTESIILTAIKSRINNKDSFIIHLKDKTNSESLKLLIFERLNVFADNRKMDTLEIKNIVEKDLPKENQRYLLYFPGNNSCYENDINHLIDSAINIGCNVIGFNYYEDIEKNTIIENPVKDVIINGIAQVQRLLDSGIYPENILLEGYSLGGGIAALITKHFHDKKIPINLFLDRTFSDVDTFVDGYIRRKEFHEITNSSGNYYKTGHKEGIPNILLSFLLKPLINFGIAVTSWEIKTANSYLSIPDKNKDYMFIRTSSKIRNDKTIDDNVITHHASLHNDTSVKEDRKLKKARLNDIIDNDRIDKDLKDKSIKAKEYFRARKMMTTDESKNGHGETNRNELKNHYGMNANQFFYRAANRMFKDKCIITDENSNVISSDSIELTYNHVLRNTKNA